MLCLNLVYRNLNCLTRYPLLTTLWLRFLFLFNLRKAPSPVVLVSKEPEKNTERLGKGAKSNKDLKRYITWVWKRRFHSENAPNAYRPHCDRGIWTSPPKKNPGHFGFVFEDICGREVVWLGWGHRFRKAPFSKCFLVYTKTQSGRFQIPLVWRVFLKSSVFVTD